MVAICGPRAPQQLQMEEGGWDRALVQAQRGESAGEVHALTLDGVVKCAQGKLPKSKVFAPFTQLKSLSIANVGLSSLADFPSLPLLERLILSDNRIAGGLEHLVYAGLTSLRELDLSNNKIQAVEDLEPLAQLRLESLDLYECTVTRTVDYRAKVFGLMMSLRFLDKTDVTGNERPESDEESEEEDVDGLNGDGFEVEGEEGFEGDSKSVALHDEEEEEVEDDEGRDEDDEDNDELEDEEEDEGGSYQEEVLAVSGRGVVQGYVNNDHDSDNEVDDEGDDNVEVQDMEESGEEEVGEDDDEDVAVEEEEVDEEEPVSGTHVSTVDVQENEDDLDENGELVHDEEGDDVEDNDAVQEEVEDEEEVEEYGTKYVGQPISQPEDDEAFEPRDDGEAQDLDGKDEDFVKEPVGLKPIRKRTREETGEEKRPAKH